MLSSEQEGDEERPFADNNDSTMLTNDKKQTERLVN